MLEFLLLALGLGIKHSFDADHLLAVSNILARVGSLKRSIKLSLSWAFGHMITALFVSALLFLFRESVLTIILDKFEFLVGVMLIVLGLVSLYQARFLHAHTHRHGKDEHIHIHMHLKKESDNHSHKHIFGIGIIHGLASNDELLVLLTISLGLTTLYDALFGVVFFTIGVVIGMVLFSALLTSSLIKVKGERMQQLVNGGVGLMSVGYGLLMLFG